MTIMEFAEHVQKIAGTQLTIEQKPLPKDDPKVRQPDITKAKQILDWEPQIPFEEGIMKTMEFFKKKLGV
jgi:dTDP-glucose 4,6-dehydratase